MGAAFFMNSMLMTGSIRRAALGLMALAVSSVTQAKPVAFKPPVELTDSINVGYPVWVDVDGDGITDFTGHDHELGKLVSYVRDPRGSQWPKKRIILEGGNPELLWGTFRYDIDGDGKMDLVTVEGRQITWWKSAQGTPLAYQGAWGEPLPPDRVVAGIEDMDKDGHPDVLLWPTSGVRDEEGKADAALIGYGSPTGGFTYLEVDFDIPLIDYYYSEVADIDGDGKPDWIFDGKIALLTNRQLSGMADVPYWGRGGQLGDLDGIPGAELFVAEGYGERDFFSPASKGPRIRILKWQGGAWVTVRDSSDSLFDGFSFQSEPMGAYLGNFDSDSSQEIAIVTDEVFIIFSYTAGEFVIERVHAVAGGLQIGDWISIGDREPDGRDSFFIQRYAGARYADMGMGIGMIFNAAPFWLHMEVPMDPFVQAHPSVVSPMHHSRSISVIQMEGGPKIASLGGHDRALHVWRSPTGADEKQTVSLNNKQGITLLAGKFRGGNTEEFAWLCSDEDSADNFSMGSKASLLEVGKPYTTDGNGISRYRKLEYSGVMPAALLGKGDFDGDGTDDLLYTNPADGTMVWRSGNDPSAVGAVGKLGAVQHEVGYMPLIVKPETLHGASPQNVAIYDADQDGDLDILQFPSIYGKSVARYTNDGSGRFSVSKMGGESGNMYPSYVPISVVVGNFDGSGAPDVATIFSVEDYYNYYDSSIITIMRNGESVSPETLTLDGSISRVVAADFNGDGLDDLVMDGTFVMRSHGGGRVSHSCQVLSRKNASSFHPPVVLSESLSNASSLAAADMNGDGKADLIHGSEISGTINYFESATVEALPTFAEWAEEKDVIGQDADSDGDGASNFYEYLTGRDPNVVETSLQSRAAPGEVPIFELKRLDEEYPIFKLKAIHQRPTHLSEGEARVVLEKSSNLRDWLPVGLNPTPVLTKDHPGWETLQWEINTAPDTDNPQPEFFRIRSWIE